MAEFSSLVITEKGQALVTKMMVSGGNGLGFTKIATSETAYPESSLSTLTSLTGVKQETGISNIEKVSSTQVKLEASIENSTITAGYTINTIGLYATDPDEGEILYAVCRALVAGYIPAYNGLSVSGATFELVVGVGAASNVNLEIDPAVVATFGDILRHEKKTPTSSAEGIHGVRYYGDKFEVFNGKNWIEMQKAYKTYGVAIDLTNSDPTSAVTYTDDAVGMVAGSSDWDSKNIFRDIRPCMFKNGAVTKYLNPNDFTKYEDGTAADITSGAEGDVMIEIPKIGVKIATSDNVLTVQVTDDPKAEGFSYHAHTRETEGDREKLYIGAFLGYNASSKLRSLSGKTPTTYISIGDTRTLAQANGDGYDQIAFYQLTLLQCLFLIKYKSRNSQTALGMGYVNADDYAPANTGGTVARGMDYGETTGKQQMKFLGIEDFWGNLYYWIDGLVSSSDYHALTATDNFNDTGDGYTDQGALSTSYIGGYMKAPQGTNELGFIIKQQGGSATTYFADYASFDAGYVPYFGGCFYVSSYAGAFRLDVSDVASSAGDIGGGRLMYL